MTKLKLLGLMLGAAGLFLADAGQATANGGGGPRLPFFRRTPVPAFQAAPWYSYWPYNQHFMTPAPMGGAYYGPPAGGGMVNPYFPAPYGYGAPQATPGTAMPAK